MTVTALPIPRRRAERTRAEVESALADREAATQDVRLDPVYDPELEIPWQAYALCAETDPEAFFPEKGGSTKNAKRICGLCPVRKECLEYALDNDERFGVWGGLSERERRKVRRDQAGNPTPPQFLPDVDLDADDTPLSQEELDIDFAAEDTDSTIAAEILERLSA